MATVCGGTLSLMDAGVPIKAPVAGIAMGLIKEGDEVVVLSDILGDEDHLGDMDFKVAGTAEGITALQMDIKIDGVTREIMRQALHQAREGRLHILEVMNRTHGRAARRHLGARAAHRHAQDPAREDPRRHRPGRQGHPRHHRGDRRARSTSRTTARSSSPRATEAGMQRAIEIIEGITVEAEVGKIYKGIVRRIVDFGAFVEILPGTDGLAAHLADRPRPRAARLRRAEGRRRDPGQGARDRPLRKDPPEPQGGDASRAATGAPRRQAASR